MYKSPKGDTCLFIALEGGDRLGKSTQARLLESMLERAGVRVIFDKSPYKDDATYERIYEMLETGDAVRHPVVFQATYGANRRFFQQQLLPTLAGHFDVVLMDRWTLSGRVYGSETGVPEKDTECIQKGLVEPDFTVVFDGTPFPAQDNGDSYETDTSFQRRIRDRYRAWAQRTPDKALLVYANRPKKVVCAEVFEVIRQRLER